MDRSHRHGAIGLRRGTLAVRDYDTRWPAEYEREKAVLTDLLNGVVERIEHVGSTAVVGLVAKPLIDIALGFSDRALLEEGRARLRTAGYDDRGDFGEEGGVVIAKGSESQRTHHLHLVLVQSDQWRRYLAFRDALRADPQLREEYAALKRRLDRNVRGNREAYQSGKGEFIQRITKRVSN